MEDEVPAVVVCVPTHTVCVFFKRSLGFGVGVGVERWDSWVCRQTLLVYFNNSYSPAHKELPRMRSHVSVNMIHLLTWQTSVHPSCGSAAPHRCSFFFFFSVFLSLLLWAPLLLCHYSGKLMRLYHWYFLVLGVKWWHISVWAFSSSQMEQILFIIVISDYVTITVNSPTEDKKVSYYLVPEFWGGKKIVLFEQRKKIYGTVWLLVGVKAFGGN